MQKLQFTIAINAPANKVYRTMLGLDDIKTYETWTKLFNPTSTFQGTWEKGTRMFFIGTDENGMQGGMVSVVEEHVPAKLVSLRHIAVLEGNKEVPDDAWFDKWGDYHENYMFEEVDGNTTVTIETDAPADHQKYFNETWPRALKKLKELTE